MLLSSSKNSKKTLDGTVLWLIYDFLTVFRIRIRIRRFLGLPGSPSGSVKTDVRIRGSGSASRSVPKCHGSTTLLLRTVGVDGLLVRRGRTPGGALVGGHRAGYVVVGGRRRHRVTRGVRHCGTRWSRDHPILQIYKHKTVNSLDLGNILLGKIAGILDEIATQKRTLERQKQKLETQKQN